MKLFLQVSGHWNWLRIAPRSSCILVLIGLAKRSLDKRSEEEKINGESEKGRKRQSNKFVVYSQILAVLLRFIMPFTPPTTSHTQTLPGRSVCCAAVRDAPMTYISSTCLLIIRLAIWATLCPSLFIWYAHSPQCHDVIPWGGKRWE